MKNLQKLLQQQEHLRNDATFMALYNACLEAQQKVVDSKIRKDEAKDAYQASIEAGERNEVSLLELLTALRQAKYMQLHEKAGYQLAKYRIEHYVDSLDRAGKKKKQSGKK